jgi:DNA ligase-1
MTDRFKANGLINSDTEPRDIYIVCWDYLTLDEWKEGKSSRPYKERFQKIINNTIIDCVDYQIVKSLDEAKDFYKKVVANGGEGAVLKNLDNKFKNGTATDNIKMKEEAVAEFRITGFQEGKGRFVGTLGAIEAISGDERVITKVSGFTDEVRDYIWNNRDKLLGTIISVKYNGVSKAKNSDKYSLMFPVFEDFRPDKDSADNLEYIKNALK